MHSMCIPFYNLYEKWLYMNWKPAVQLYCMLTPSTLLHKTK